MIQKLPEIEPPKDETGRIRKNYQTIGFIVKKVLDLKKRKSHGILSKKSMENYYYQIRKGH